MPPKKKGKSNQNVYEKAEDLPEGRKKLYDSILEDFDKQVEARIEQLNSAIGSLQKQIKSQFKMKLLQQSRATRQLKVEDLYYKDKDSSSEEEKTDLNVECAKLAVSISNNISKEVKTTVCGGVTKGKKSPPATKGRRTKKSSILACHGAVPSSGVRRSTRKKLATSWLDETGPSATPLASSTLTAAALGGFSTAKTSRSKGRLLSAAQTPMITPKFDMATPLNRTVSRTAKADEKFLMSMQGSPVYVGGRSRSTKNENLIPLPIGNGQTLMVPADNPEVQPLLQSLIQNCMKLMKK